MRASILALPLLLTAAPALAAPLDDDDNAAAAAALAASNVPAPLKLMLEAAIESGNENDVAIIVKYARTAAPDSADQLVKIAADWRDARTKKAQAKIRSADFFALVKGHAELGGYVTTGNTENVGIAAAMELKRDGLQWRHKLRLQGDYQESLGITTRERYLAAYEPNWKFDDRAYLYGAAQYESDRFSGFSDRVSLSSGIGYSAIKSPKMKLDLEVGPAFRYTRFIAQPEESNAAARGSLDFGWKITKGISVTQNASAYLQDANSTISSKSALLTKLFGPLSAQFSYSLQYESTPAIGRKSTDSTSRAALVVDF
jgi:putative salt-induced outer membrane protein